MLIFLYKFRQIVGYSEVESVEILVLNIGINPPLMRLLYE